MPLYTKESLETLRQRVDLADFLSSHLELKKTGAAYKALCPFHDEKSPSFVLQKGDTHYHCFGCGVHGDAIHFMMNHMKMGFSDAVESLAQRYHVHLERVEGQAEQKGPPKAKLKEALDQAARFYHFMLLHTPEGHAALKYLYHRGLDLEFIQQFMVGLAPAASGLLRKFMHAKTIYDEVLEGAGLIAPRNDGGWRDFFSDRITFPIRDPMGAVIGFSARKYKEETYGGKYVNTSETTLFKKSRVLFGLNYSRRRIAKERIALIVEGQIDALRLIQVGFNFTVAGQGTAFGEGHVKELLTLGVHLVYLALDSDNAGQEATVKIGNLFQKAGVEVKVVQMPVGMDPDSFLREKGAEDFLQLIEASIDYLTFLVRHHGRKLSLDSPAQKNELINLISGQIREWDHPVMVQESLRKLAHLTQVSEAVVGASQEHMPNVYIKRQANIGLQTINPDLILETDFIRWVMLMGDLKGNFVELARMNIKPEDLHVAACREIYQVYLDLEMRQQPRDILSLTLLIEDPEGQQILSELMQKKVNRDRGEEHYVETMQKILDRNWMEQREQVRMKIQSAQCSDDEVIALVKQFEEIKRNIPKVVLKGTEGTKGT